MISFPEGEPLWLKQELPPTRMLSLPRKPLLAVGDVVLDIEAGRLAYAVLSFGGFLGMGDKYFAIPWEAFRFDATGKSAILNVAKVLLENAPGFDKDHWPNMTDSAWGNQIFAHYGYRPYWEEPPTGSRRDRF